MAYMIDRGDGMVIGPFSLEDLQRKVADNELALTDRACPQEGGVWLPVSKLLAGHTGDMALITSGKIDASTIFASFKRFLSRSKE
jgi:hypothetical protein